MNFLQRTPFVRLLLALIVGIVLFQLLPDFPSWFVLLFFIGSIPCLGIYLFIKNPNLQYKYRWIFGAGVFLLFIALGFVLSKYADKQSEFNFSNSNRIYSVELVAPPVEKANSFLCKIKLKGVYENEWLPENGNAIVYIQKDSLSTALQFGDILLIDTKFAAPQKALNPDAFDYAKYLQRQGIGATAYISGERWQKVSENSSFSLSRMADKCRSFLLNIYRNLGLTGDEFAVVAALTLGYTDEINPDLIEGYNATGAVHILSVSGLHVGIIYAFLLFLLSFLDKSKKRRIVKGIIIILFMWFYAFLTGLSPSVVRSAFMFSFVAFALCLNRKSEIYNSIFMSAFFMLLINPNNLFNIGFQLSYSAVLSIVIFSAPAQKLLQSKIKPIQWIWNTIMVSIAAQLGTAPFTIYYFHQFPAYFLITNLIAIPLSTLIIYLAIVVLAVSFIPILSTVLAFILDKSLWLLNNSISYIQHMPSSVIPVSVDFVQMWLLVAVIVFFTIYSANKKFVPMLFGFASLLAVVSFNVFTKYKTLSSHKVMVYAGQRNTHVNFVSGEKNTVFSTDSAELVRLAKNYWDNNKLKSPDFIGENDIYSNGFISFLGKRFCILTDDFLHKKTSNHPMKVDFLIVGAFQKPRMNEILQCILPEKVIICSGVSQWYTKHIMETCHKLDIPTYSVASEGAFVLNLDK